MASLGRETNIPTPPFKEGSDFGAGKKVHKSTDPKQSHGNDVTFSTFHPDPNSSETNPKFLQSVNAMSAPVALIFGLSRLASLVSQISIDFLM
uniref:Uncharacterized protein n=1 Tax=Cannabis sativa TaxID=3483 RepID=A0A803R6T8_CANSA